MPNKLMIVMVNTDPTNGAELGAPFFQAAVAAAMEYDVEVIFLRRAPANSRLKASRKNCMSRKAARRVSTTLSRTRMKQA